MAESLLLVQSMMWGGSFVPEINVWLEGRIPEASICLLSPLLPIVLSVQSGHVASSFTRRRIVPGWHWFFSTKLRPFSHPNGCLSHPLMPVRSQFAKDHTSLYTSSEWWEVVYTLNANCCLLYVAKWPHYTYYMEHWVRSSLNLLSCFEWSLENIHADRVVIFSISLSYALCNWCTILALMFRSRWLFNYMVCFMSFEKGTFTCVCEWTWFPKFDVHPLSILLLSM